MKKALFFIGGVIIGYSLNTEPGKKLRIWTSSKVHEQINNLVSKINKVTNSDSDTPDSPSSSSTEEGK